MKKVFLSLTFVFFIFLSAGAQDYKTGIGLRGGWDTGLTIKHFLGEKSAVEGLLISRWRGFGITGLYEIHNQAFDVERLRWYYGFGGHIGFWNGDHTPWGDVGVSYTVVGIDGILGMEYSFKQVPINLGLDWKPAFNIAEMSGFWGDNGALSIRFIF